MGRSSKPGIERRQEILRLLRSGASVDTTDLSRRLGVSEMTIVNWEKDRSAPQGNRLVRLAEALGI